MAYRWFVVSRILFSLVYNAFYEKVRTRMVEGCYQGLYPVSSTNSGSRV